LINFRSDNEVGAHPRIIEAVSRAFSSGSAPSYGADEWTHRVENRLRDIFDKPDLVAYPVGVGTAANVLALACCTPPWGSVYCHPVAHIAAEETNALEFYSGARLVRVDGPAGKIDPKQLAEALAQPVYGVVHFSQPSAVSLTQATEHGTVYAPEEIAAIATSAHRHGLKMHMDGARFANALSFVGCTPSELTWKAGIDVLSLGATKNGAMAAEVVIFFNTELAQGFEYRRKRGGHLVSKMRLVSAQLDAYFSDGLWLDNARHANAMARRLVAGLTALKGVQLLYPVDANEIFVVLPAQVHDALQAAGAQYHPWPSDRPGERAFRLVTAFDTEPAAVDKFLAVAKGSLGSKQMSK
jgi:threonine aldolase